MNSSAADSLWIGVAVACGCGLLIGLERERRKDDSEYHRFAGVRSFAVAAMAGALAAALESPLLVGAGAALIVGLAVATYARSRSTDTGVTTELALFVTYLVGVSAIHRPAFAAAAGALLAALLALRERLHRFTREILTAEELRSGLTLAVAALVILPLAPDHNLGDSGINARTVWRVVVLLMLVQSAGHLALRAWGPRWGLALSGVASGFVSSAGTIALFGARARTEPGLLADCVAGGLASCVATFLQMALIVAAVDARLLGNAGPMLCAGLATSVLVTGPWLRRAPAGIHPARDSGVERRVFAPWLTLAFALLLVGLSAGIAWLSARLGASAALAAGGLAGFADVHAASAGLLNLGREGQLPPRDCLGGIALALSCNTLTKVFGSFIGGGLAYGWRMTLGLALILAAVWAGWWWGA